MPRLILHTRNPAVHVAADRNHSSTRQVAQASTSQKLRAPVSSQLKFFVEIANTFPRTKLTAIFSGCYREQVGRGSSVVEQPIRNRQVVGSTPTLGSRYSLWDQSSR